jgi:transposase
MTLILGIDVAKQTLDVFDSHDHKHHNFNNNQEDITQLINLYQNFSQKRAIIESTGVYQRLIHKKLGEA